MAGAAVGDEPPARHVLSKFGFDSVLEVSNAKFISSRQYRFVLRSWLVTLAAMIAIRPLCPRNPVSGTFACLR